METFTLHDMLKNSTNLYKILCDFGIKTVSECDDESQTRPEPKGNQIQMIIMHVGEVKLTKSHCLIVYVYYVYIFKSK